LADNTTGLGGSLNQELRKLHRIYGNYNTTGRYLLFGTGAINLMNAYIAAVTAIRGNRPQILYAKPPYYYFYSLLCQIQNCTFTTSETLDPSNMIEGVTEPNNPDGFSRSPFYPTNPYWFNDLVYYWPHLGGFGYDLAMKNSDVAIFSFTKLSGHAGNRFGWAFVKDKQIVDQMQYWILINHITNSVTSSAFALQIIRELNKNGNQFFNWTIQRLQARWTQFTQLLGTQQNIILRSKVGTQYAWLEFVGKNDTEVRNMCLNVGLNPYAGSLFGQSGYLRLNLCEGDVTFGRIIQAMELLVNNTISSYASIIK